MGKSRRSFTDEFKREAVRRLGAGEHTLSHIARELGIHPTLLQTWRRKFSPGGTAANADSLVDLKAENRRLRRAISSLREDRKILKKSSVFFAKDPDEIRVHPGAKNAAQRTADVPTAQRLVG